jgi:proline iminopeptidase
VSGPPDIAWQLHKAWPGSRLVLLDDAGHGGGSFPNEITAALNLTRPLT